MNIHIQGLSPDANTLDSTFKIMGTQQKLQLRCSYLPLRMFFFIKKF